MVYMPIGLSPIRLDTDISPLGLELQEGNNMSYLEMISRALKGRSVNAAAKQWGVPQKTMDRYAKGERLPDYATAMLIAREAGIGLEEAFQTLAAEETKRKTKTDKLSEGFKSLLRAANACWIRVPAAA